MPPARREGGEQFVSRVGGVGQYLSCPPQGPGGMQVVEGWQIAADHPLCRADDTLQPALILGCGCGVPDGDGGGEDGLDDGGVEVHHHRLWQVEFLQLPQEEHPLLCFFDEGAAVLLPFEVLGDDGAQEAERLHSSDWGVTQSDGGVRIRHIS